MNTIKSKINKTITWLDTKHVTIPTPKLDTILLKIHKSTKGIRDMVSDIDESLTLYRTNRNLAKLRNKLNDVKILETKIDNLLYKGKQIK